MTEKRTLTALEATAMGIILKRGPCVAHTIVAQFSDSHTFAYRSGAGSIYPLLRRLTESGLLELTRRKYTLTEDGVKALREWILPPYPPEMIGTNLDVLRSRVYFLALLTPDELETFCNESIRSLEHLLTGCRGVLEEQRASGDHFGELAMLGAIFETEARIKWIQHVAKSTSCTLAPGDRPQGLNVISKQS